MTAAEDYDHLRHVLDHLPPTKLRHLRLLVDADPEIAPYAEAGGAEAGGAEPPVQRLSFAGIGDSGRSDLSEHHRELIRDGIGRER
ncbi:hypothetical protein [Streptomyces cavernicola]|uniref:Uncharacterized protein n=1 Tax=Streptomyces cavernicola TaxID=3043613 RepID=A0ABT6SME3_9ACTN|nr:hypothetical protein [Streptomyces sp. B-S-A6]MDI3409140.1 hypothetical protein [Streptomyces sp. B-S-A6]